MTSFLIQRLSLYQNNDISSTIFVTSICKNPESKIYTPIFVSPTNAINDNFIKIEESEKFSLGIKKKYSTYDFKIVLNESSQKYELHYNNMPTYTIKEYQSDKIIYSMDDEYLFISTENNTFFHHPISNFIKEEDIKETKPKKNNRKKDLSPKVDPTILVEKSESTPIMDVKAVEHVESVEQVESVEEVEHVESVESVEEVEHVESVESVESVEQVESVEEVESVEAGEQVKACEEEEVKPEYMLVDNEYLLVEDVGEEKVLNKSKITTLPMPFVYQNKIYKTNVCILSGMLEKSMVKILNEKVPTENFIFKENKKSEYGLMIEDKRAYVVNIQHQKYLLLRINHQTLLIQDLTNKKFENVSIGNNITIGNIQYTLCTLTSHSINSPLLLIPIQSTKVFDNKYGLNKMIYSPKLSY